MTRERVDQSFFDKILTVEGLSPRQEVSPGPDWTDKRVWVLDAALKTIIWHYTASHFTDPAGRIRLPEADSITEESLDENSRDFKPENKALKDLIILELDDPSRAVEFFIQCQVELPDEMDRVLSVLRRVDDSKAGEFGRIIESGRTRLSEDDNEIIDWATDVLLSHQNGAVLTPIFLTLKADQVKNKIAQLSHLLNYQGRRLPQFEEGLALLTQIVYRDQELREDLIKVYIDREASSIDSLKQKLSQSLTTKQQIELLTWLNRKAERLRKIPHINEEIRHSLSEYIHTLEKTKHREDKRAAKQARDRVDASITTEDGRVLPLGPEEWRSSRIEADRIYQWMRKNTAHFAPPDDEKVVVFTLTLLSKMANKEYNQVILEQNPYQALWGMIKKSARTYPDEVADLFGSSDSEIRSNLDRLIGILRLSFYNIITRIKEASLNPADWDEADRIYDRSGLPGLIGYINQRAKRKPPNYLKSWLEQVAKWDAIFDYFAESETQRRIRRARRDFYRPYQEEEEMIRQVMEGGGGGQELNRIRRALGFQDGEFMYGMYSSERVYKLILNESAEVRSLHEDIKQRIEANPTLKTKIEGKLEAFGVSWDQAMSGKEFYLIKAFVSVYNSWVSKGRPDQGSWAYIHEDVSSLTDRLGQVFFHEIGRLMMVHGVSGEAQGLNNKAQLEVSVLFLLLPTQMKTAVKGMVKGINLTPKFLELTIAQMEEQRMLLVEEELNAVQRLEAGVNYEGQIRKLHFSDFLTAWELWSPDTLSKYTEEYQKYRITPKLIELYILSTDNEEKDAIILTVAELAAKEAGIDDLSALSDTDKLRLKFMVKGSLAWMVATMTGYKFLGYYGLHKHKVKALREFRLYIEKYGGPALQGLGMETIAPMIDRVLKGENIYVFQAIAESLIPGDAQDQRVKSERETIINAFKHLFFEETQPDNPILRPVGDTRAIGYGGISGDDLTYEYVWKPKSARDDQTAHLTGFFDNPETAQDLQFLFDKLADNPEVYQQIMDIFDIDEDLLNQIRDRMQNAGAQVSWYTNRRLDQNEDRERVLDSVALVRAMMKRWTWRLVGNKKLAEGLYEAYVEFESNTVFDYFRYSKALEAVSNLLFQFSSAPTESLLFQMFEILSGTTLGDPGTQIFMYPLVDYYIEWHKGRKLLTAPWNHHERLDWNMPMKRPLDGLTLRGTDIPVTETAQIQGADPITGMPIAETVTLKEFSDVRNDWSDKLSIYKRALPLIGGDGVSLMHIIHGRYWAKDEYVLNKYDIMKTLHEYRGRRLILPQMVKKLAYKHVGRLYYWKYNLGLHWLEFDNLLKIAAILTGVAGAGVALSALEVKRQ